MTRVGFKTTRLLILLPLAMLVLLALLLIARRTTAHLAGKWTGSVAQTSGPNISSTTEFHPDGTMTSVTKTPAGTVSGTGTYTVAGDKLTIHASDVTTTFPSGGSVTGHTSGDQVLTVRVQGDTLSLTQNGHTAQYTRTME